MPPKTKVKHQRSSMHHQHQHQPFAIRQRDYTLCLCLSQLIRPHASTEKKNSIRSRYNQPRRVFWLQYPKKKILSWRYFSFPHLHTLGPNPHSHLPQKGRWQVHHDRLCRYHDRRPPRKLVRCHQDGQSKCFGGNRHFFIYFRMCPKTGCPYPELTPRLSLSLSVFHSLS